MTMQTHVYVGASARTGGAISGVFRRSANDGDWQHLTSGFVGDTHVHALAVHPDDPAVVFAATSTGLYRSRNRGGQWQRLVPPADGEQMWSVLVHPSDHRTIVTGTAPLGLYRSDDGGETWRGMPRPAVAERMVGAFPARVMRLAVSPSRPSEIYAGMEVNGAMRSDDGAETWTDCSDPLVALSHQPNLQSAILTKDTAEGMLDVHAICVSPDHRGTVFLALRMGLFCSQDRGATWQDLDIGQHAPHLRYGRDIVVAPWDASDMLACIADSSRGKAGRLYRSRDGGENWAQFDHSIDVRSTMMAVALTPFDRRQAHCVTRGGQTFSTSDDGGSWREFAMPEGCGAAVAVACG
jgi:photosystem II stability/assembly factor-like uncharacterized protein